MGVPQKSKAAMQKIGAATVHAMRYRDAMSDEAISALVGVPVHHIDAICESVNTAPYDPKAESVRNHRIRSAIVEGAMLRCARRVDEDPAYMTAIAQAAKVMADADFQQMEILEIRYRPELAQETADKWVIVEDEGFNRNDAHEKQRQREIEHSSTEGADGDNPSETTSAHSPGIAEPRKDESDSVRPPVGKNGHVSANGSAGPRGAKGHSRPQARGHNHVAPKNVVDVAGLQATQEVNLA